MLLKTRGIHTQTHIEQDQVTSLQDLLYMLAMVIFYLTMMLCTCCTVTVNTKMTGYSLQEDDALIAVTNDVQSSHSHLLYYTYNVYFS